jgi:hypothetical protein
MSDEPKPYASFHSQRIRVTKFPMGERVFAIEGLWALADEDDNLINQGEIHLGGLICQADGPGEIYLDTGSVTNSEKPSVGEKVERAKQVFFNDRLQKVCDRFMDVIYALHSMLHLMLEGDIRELDDLPNCISRTAMKAVLDVPLGRQVVLRRVVTETVEAYVEKPEPAKPVRSFGS